MRDLGRPRHYTRLHRTRQAIDSLARRGIAGDMPLTVPVDLWEIFASDVRDRMDATMAVSGMLDARYGAHGPRWRNRESLSIIQRLRGGTWP